MRSKAIKTIFITFYLFTFLFVAYRSGSGQDRAEVPSIDPDYTKDVETWWQTHPFNPENPDHIPIGKIPSPPCVKTLIAGDDLQAAIDSLPETGGTLCLGGGLYSHNIDIVGKSHIHIIGLSNPDSADPVIIKGGINYDELNLSATPSIAVSSNITACPLMKDYSDFASVIGKYTKGNDEYQAYIDCYSNPIRDFYFRNIIFDGGGVNEIAFFLRGVRDFVLDDVRFQNFHNPGGRLIAYLYGNINLTNIWCRGCDFGGSQTYAYVLDGVFGGGLINSHVRSNFSSGGVVFITNDDFSFDYNRNGVIEEEEQRTSKYAVIYGNTIDVGPIPMNMHAKNSLFKNNIATAEQIKHFISFFARASSHYDDPTVKPFLQYQYFGNRIVGNHVVNTAKNFLVMNAFKYSSHDCDPAVESCGRIGQYQVRDNIVGNLNENLVLENNTSTMKVEGPNIACGNVVAETPYDPECDAGSFPVPDPNLTQKLYLPVLQTPISSDPVDPIPSTREYFPLGVFEASGRLGVASQFESLLEDLQSHHLDSIMVVNGTSTRADEYLTIADNYNFSVFWQNGVELNEQWWPDNVPATMDKAREVIYPLVDEMRASFHPSLKGHYTKDEPYLDHKDKVWLANQAYQERDPKNPAFAVLVGINRIQGIFNPDVDKVLVMDHYTLRAANGPCIFQKAFTDPDTGEGYDFVKFIRDAITVKPAATPLWIILQAHFFNSQNNDSYDLRYPSVEELRAQQWMAVGEGATGIFWFIYGSNPDGSVLGFKERSDLYTEISDLARRLSPLRSTLVNLYKVSDQFTMNGMPAGTLPYASSLKNFDGTREFVVAVNRSCSPQLLTLRSSTIQGELRDLETGQLYPYGTPIAFRGGDGRIFEVVPSVP